MEQRSKATANWQGGLADGSGTTRLGTGIGGEMAMSWTARTEGADGQSSPEELLAGAHATCFNMALSKVLADAGHPPARLETTATTTFETGGEQGSHVASTHLSVHGSVPGMDTDTFLHSAETAAQNCPISKAVRGNIEITVDSSLN
ncbi:MAG: OsmC family peroxiredoxin [Actinomycetota bacterium]